VLLSSYGVTGGEVDANPSGLRSLPWKLAQGRIPPFNSNPAETTYHEPATLVERQQLLPGPSEVEPAPDFHGLSSTLPPVVPHSRPVEPVPARLSSRQLARLRMEALSSQRSNGQSSSSNESPTQSTLPSTVVTSRSGATSTSDSRRLSP